MGASFETLRRSLIRVQGPDAPDFLHGLLTQSVKDMAEETCVYGALLTPQGKVSADMFVWRVTSECYLLDVAASQAEGVMGRLMLYKLRANVTIDAPEGLLALAGLEEGASGVPADLAQVDPRFADGALGWRFVVALSGGIGTNPVFYEQRRLAVGAPDLAQDAGEVEVFGLEALLEELNGVDFKKGCFVGQENISRMKRRATTRKKFCPVSFSGAVPGFNTPIMAGEAQIGHVRTGRAERAIALIRLDRALEAADKGVVLMAGETILTLDPPDWLLMPEGKDDA